MATAEDGTHLDKTEGSFLPAAIHCIGVWRCFACGERAAAAFTMLDDDEIHAATTAMGAHIEVFCTCGVLACFTLPLPSQFLADAAGNRPSSLTLRLGSRLCCAIPCPNDVRH
mgnify:CR=1 FL=1